MNKIDELLKPRYKVIVDYPDCDFKVGSILPEDVVFHEEWKIKKYPHIFQPLPWWADRKESEMPEYVKNSNHVFKVRKWLHGSDLPDGYWASLEGHSSNYARHFTPATQSDYDTYILKQK